MFFLGADLRLFKSLELYVCGLLETATIDGGGTTDASRLAVIGSGESGTGDGATEVKGARALVSFC